MMPCSKYLKECVLFVCIILLARNANGQDCDCVKDTFYLTDIKSLGANGRPYLNAFVFRPNEFASILKLMDTCKSIEALLNYCASNGVLIFDDFPVPGSPDNPKCDSLPSKSIREKSEKDILGRYLKLLHKFKNERVFLYNDSSKVAVSSVKASLVLWKNKSKTGINMLHYSSGMYFSTNVHYDKPYYFEIKNLY